MRASDAVTARMRIMAACALALCSKASRAQPTSDDSSLSASVFISASAEREDKGRFIVDHVFFVRATQRLSGNWVAAATFGAGFGRPGVTDVDPSYSDYLGAKIGLGWIQHSSKRILSGHVLAPSSAGVLVTAGLQVRDVFTYGSVGSAPTESLAPGFGTNLTSQWTPLYGSGYSVGVTLDIGVAWFSGDHEYTVSVGPIITLM